MNLLTIVISVILIVAGFLFWLTPIPGGLPSMALGFALLIYSSDRAAGPYPTMVGDTPVVQAYAYSKYLGHLVLTFDDAGNVTSATGDTIVIDASVEPDAAVAARDGQAEKPGGEEERGSSHRHALEAGAPHHGAVVL